MDIKMPKQLSQFDTFLLKNNQQPTPRRSNLAPYPHKNTQPARKLHNMKENQPLIQNKSRSPARSASRKALIVPHDSQNSINYDKQRSKSRLLKTAKRHCQNHEEIEGNYHITIEGEELFYCQKCANKLRSQGFPVRMESSSTCSNSRLKSNKSSKLLQTYTHLEGHPQFETLQLLLQTIYEAQRNIKKTEEIKFQELLDGVEARFSAYMNCLEDLLKEKRAFGLECIQKMKQDYTNQSYEQERVRAQSLTQIETMKNDIESNIESIVGEVDQVTFEQCVQNYNERLAELNKISHQRTRKLDGINNKQKEIDSEIYGGLKEELQKVLVVNRIELPHQVPQVPIDILSSGNSSIQLRGAFRNLFQVGQNVDRKRVISKR